MRLKGKRVHVCSRNKKKGEENGRESMDRGLFFSKGVCAVSLKEVNHSVKNRTMQFTCQTRDQVFSEDTLFKCINKRTYAADADETLVICRMLLVYLWRGQLPQGRGKGSSLANPACNKQYNITLLQQSPRVIVVNKASGCKKTFMQSHSTKKCITKSSG